MRSIRYSVAAGGLFIALTLGPSGGAVAEEDGHHAASPHHLALFVGATDVDHEGTEATLGLDYEYRVGPRLGLGGVVEHAFGEIDATTVLAVADVHLDDRFVLQLGPGWEFGHSHDVFVARVGLLYEFHRGELTIAPQIHYDWHDGSEDALVFGIGFGRSF